MNGEYKTYDLGYAIVEAVQAGNNRNHDINDCVGWLITLPGDISIYATGDTSTTDQMAELAKRDIHYAFFVCDGRFNMDMDEVFYNNLSDELKAKIKACQNDEELKSLLAAEKIELDPEMMGKVSGGGPGSRDECPTVFRDSLLCRPVYRENVDGSCKDYVCKRFFR